jgi:hypothetical protein
MSLTPEEIVENFDKFRSLCEKLGDRSEVALAMVDSLGERLAICPASSRLSYHCAYSGGLVEHSLHVLSNALKLCKAFEWNVPRDSLIVACLFHDFGKIGSDTEDYYIPQDSDWHKEKLGEVYKHNKDILFMTVPDRSLWLCQHYGLKLTQEEYVAILIHDGQVVDDNKSYRMKEPKLADIVHLADFVACKQEKEEQV